MSETEDYIQAALERLRYHTRQAEACRRDAAFYRLMAENYAELARQEEIIKHELARQQRVASGGFVVVIKI